MESVDSFGSEDGLGLEECLFCSHISTTLEENLQHMSVKHGFFVPDTEFVSDLEGLITYLGKSCNPFPHILLCPSFVTINILEIKGLVAIERELLFQGDLKHRFDCN